MFVIRWLGVKDRNKIHAISGDGTRIVRRR